MSDKPECELCGDSGTMFYPNGGPWGAGARGKCPHLDGGKTSDKYRIAAGLREATTKDEVVAVMVGGRRMSDEPTMRQKGIRGLIAALDIEKPHPSMVELYKIHPDGILANADGVPVMPIYRIVEVVLAAALPEGDLFVWCPDCDGVGEIETMAHDPTLSETVRPCTRCDGYSVGMVKIERETE